MALYIGLMSGTSMGSVDAVLADVSSGAVTVHHQHSTPIPEALTRRLALALDTAGLHALELWRLDVEVGELFALAAKQLLEAAGVEAAEITAIGSHGQTLYHAPDDRPPLTVQVGDPNVIAARTEIVTVADFRRMDVAAGGQGAPLAPLFHRVAFAGERPRAIVNLGGIANLTVVPAGGAGPLLGFDTGPANTLLDLWCAAHVGEPFDADGRWGQGGRVLQPLLARMLEEPYFRRPPPKSTGREQFNRAWLDSVLRLCPAERAADVQRTLVELTAATVADGVLRFAPETDRVFLCGGGTLNGFLVQRIRALLADHPVESTAALGVPPVAVEGAAFAWLAHERLAGRAVGEPSVTGASRRTTLGGVYRP